MKRKTNGQTLYSSGMLGCITGPQRNQKSVGSGLPIWGKPCTSTISHTTIDTCINFKQIIGPKQIEYRSFFFMSPFFCVFQPAGAIHHCHTSDTSAPGCCGNARCVLQDLYGAWMRSTDGCLTKDTVSWELARLQNKLNIWVLNLMYKWLLNQ